MLYQDLSAPDWFLEAVNTPYEDFYITIEGCKIHYQHWVSNHQNDGLLFIHGGGAHSHWWDFIAPAFIDRYNVAALDISGMGDSDHREKYSSTQFANEIMGVIDHANLTNTTLIAHSFGGLAALRAALDYPQKLDALIVMDSMIFPPNFSQDTGTRPAPFKSKKVYSDKETAMSKFRLVPPQECNNDFIIKFIAQHSMEEVINGWSWKFDMEFVQKSDMGNLKDEIIELKIPTSVIYGENSMLFMPASVDFMKSIYSKDVPFYCLPNAAHHLFLDQPQECIQLLNKILNT